MFGGRTRTTNSNYKLVSLVWYNKFKYIKNDGTEMESGFVLLESVSIKNYKSIDNTGLLEMGKPFTILAGRNNVGKTATIEALYRCLKGQPNTANMSGGVLAKVFYNPALWI